MVRAQPIRPALFTAILVIVSLVTSIFTALARADPSVNDNGNGTKTAAWDFTNPANYTLSNVRLEPDDARLESTPSGWVQTSDADFLSNGTLGPTARATNDSLQLLGNDANLVANGDFSQTTDWSPSDGL